MFTNKSKLLYYLSKFQMLFILLILTNSMTLKAQLSSLTLYMQDNSEYSLFRNRAQSYIDSILPTLDSVDSLNFFSGAGEYKAFNKFTTQWDHKLLPNGTFEDYFHAVETFYNSTILNYDYVSESSWIEIGPTKVQSSSKKGIGPVEFITIFDTDIPDSTRYMLTGSLLGGLFYSEDFGENWISTGTDQWPQSGVVSAVFDPGNHKKWYAASSGNNASGSSSWVGFTGGIYRTENQGATWYQIADQYDFRSYYTIIYKILIHPTDQNILYAATSNGIFRTSNCNAEYPTWSPVYNSFVYDLEMKPGNSQYLYATGKSGNYWSILESADNGLTFHPITSPIQIEFPQDFNDAVNALVKRHLTIEVSKARPGYLYSSSYDYGSKRFYTLDLSNQTSWTQFCQYTDLQDYGWGHAFAVEQVNNGLEVLASNSSTIARINVISGQVYYESPVHVDLEDFVYHPYNSGEVWAATHGGVEKRNQVGQTWQPKYNGLGVAQVQKFATSYTDPKYIISGLYHDGPQVTNTEYSSSNWNPN